jgi:hypothetical protein
LAVDQWHHIRLEVLDHWHLARNLCGQCHHSGLRSLYRLA